MTFPSAVLSWIEEIQEHLRFAKQQQAFYYLTYNRVYANLILRLYFYFFISYPSADITALNVVLILTILRRNQISAKQNTLSLNMLSISCVGIPINMLISTDLYNFPVSSQKWILHFARDNGTWTSERFFLFHNFSPFA